MMIFQYLNALFNMTVQKSTEHNNGIKVRTLNLLQLPNNNNKKYSWKTTKKWFEM